MAILSLREVSFSYGGTPLIEGATLQIERGERIALVGRNGTGKSTLMRLMRGELKPDTGTVDISATTKIARQIQEVPTGESGTLFAEVANGLGDIGPAVAAHYRLHRQSEHLDAADLATLTQLAEPTSDDLAIILD